MHFPIRKVCRNFDNRCMKALKIGNIWVFCQIRCQFETFSTWKPQLTLWKNQLDNKVLQWWPFLTFHQRSLSKIWQNLHKIWENWNFGFLVYFGANLMYFQLENRNYFFKKHYWTTNLFLVDSFQHSNLRSLLKIWQKLHKNFENWKTLGFLSFSVSMWNTFQLENSNYPSGKAYWTTTSCHIERFQHSNCPSLSKIWQKLHENVKNRKILEFLSFLR